MTDELGDRMKGDYENRTRYMLPRRTHTIIRLDGKSFHTYTRGLDRPFDMTFIEDMALTATAVAKEVQGCKLAYVQSDEISLVLTDTESPTTQAWFDGNLQKMVSVSASIATAYFNEYRRISESQTGVPITLAMFDSRAFTVPAEVEVVNYLIWRQKDALRNSVQMAAQALLGHTACHGKNSSQLQEAMFQSGTNWNDYPVECKRGTLVDRVSYDGMTEGPRSVPAQRKRWEARPAPEFSQSRTQTHLIVSGAVRSEGDS